MVLAPLHIAAEHTGTQRTRTQLGGPAGEAALEPQPHAFRRDLPTPLPTHRPNQGPSQVSWMWVRSANAATAEWDPVRSPASQSLALADPWWMGAPAPCGSEGLGGYEELPQTPAPTHGRLCAGRTIIRNRPICDSEELAATSPTSSHRPFNQVHFL